MPIYEYRCGECGYQKEYLQRMSDAPLTDCPNCGKRAFNKLVTAAGFQLKGTGWYATDFKNGSAKPATKDKAADSAKPAAKDKAADSAKAAEATSKEPSKSDAACGTGACPA